MFARKGLIQVEKDRAPDEEQAARDRARGGRRRPRPTPRAPGTSRPTRPRSRAVRDAISAAGVPMLSAELTMIPQTTVPVEGGQAKQVLQLLEALEDLDDTQNVYANFDIPESVMAELSS